MYRTKSAGSEMKKSVFITGCNRGIGLGLVKEFLKNENVSMIIAGTRSLEKAEELLQVSDDARLQVVEIDVEKEATIRSAFSKAEELVGDGGLDLLINNAGVCLPLSVHAPIDREKATANYDVNVTGTLSVIQNFKPLLTKAVNGKRRAQIVNISSIMASMAALNMLTRCLSIEYADEAIGVTAISPGWVQTEMGGEGAQISVDECAEALVKFTLDLGEEHNGKFYNYDSTPMDW